MKSRTVDSQHLLKNFCLAHKLTSRADAENKLTALGKFLQKPYVTKAAMQYSAPMISLGDFAQYQSLGAKLNLLFALVDTTVLCQFSLTMRVMIKDFRQ